jgi:threonylcarbamoyladenosine tRNA methylthiotransferase MtaB
VTTVAFATLGCRLNQTDSHALQALVEARGFRTVPVEASPDVVVVNTCAVTARAEASNRQVIRRAARLNPRARVVVTGCWAQTSPGRVAALGCVDLVVGTADRARLPDLLAELDDTPRGTRVEVGDLAGARLEPPAGLARSARARAFVKVQDGCRHRCAFCIVPLARGRSRSRAPEVVEEQVRGLVETGHLEVVLTGVDLGHYGADLTPPVTLARLVARLAGVSGLRWLRLSSLLPAYVTDALFEVVTGSPVVAPHFHLPLQSGSDRVLRAMRRPYTAAGYRRVVERLASAIPRLGLGADVLVGFPGETDADFACTLDLVQALPFTYLHVFPYSSRPGTEAAARPGQLDASTVADRARRVRAAGEAAARRFRASLVGHTEEALVLERRDGASGDLVGLTGRYVEVVFPGSDTLQRRLVRVRVTSTDARATRGNLEAA